MSLIQQSARRSSDLSRMSLGDWLIDETIRQWTPEDEERPARPFSLPKPKTDEELKESIWQYLGMRLSDTVVVPGHSTPFRAVADAFFARSATSVWYGARALAGKTMCLAILAWCEAALLQASVSVLGGSQEQSLATQEYLQTFWRSPTMPIEILDGIEPGMITTKLRWGNKIKALACSQTKARGGHPERLRIDEADDLDWNVFQAVTGQPMTKGDVQSQTVICSTMQNTDGTMSKVLKMAAERGWPVHIWGYHETLEPHGWLTRAQVARKKSEMTAESWRVEVELGEPNAEGRAIMSEKVEAMFKGPIIVDRESVMLEFEPPVLNAVYATGADWAKTSDFTAIATLRVDVNPMRLVAYERSRRRPMPEQVKKLDDRIVRYPGEACHDNTGGGSYLADWIEQSVEPVNMVGRARLDLFTNYINGVERDEIRAPRVQSLHSDHKYATTKDLFQGGHPPDGFVAMAMAYKASQTVALGLAGSGARPVAADVAEQQAEGIQSMLSFLGGNGKGGNGAAG